MKDIPRTSKWRIRNSFIELIISSSKIYDLYGVFKPLNLIPGLLLVGERGARK